MTVIRVEKRHPDGSLRRVGRGYVIAVSDGITLVHHPPGTTFWHANGIWVTEVAFTSAFHEGWSFVPHREFGRADGIYVDIARDVTVAPDVAAFNDLFLDLMITREGVREKDEELLVRLSASEAAHVRAVRDELRERITKGEPAFDLDAALWLLPAGADRMKPLDFGPAT